LDREWLKLPDSCPVQVVYNGVEFENLGPVSGPNSELRHELGFADGTFVIGGAFRLSEEKRPLLWLEIAAKLAAVRPEFRFVIIGDGSMRQAMLEYASAHGLNGVLHMSGAVDDVGNWYRAMDMLMLTSRREGLANVLIEAQHFGVPVLAPDIGGIGETMIPGITGILLDADADADAFAAAALRIADDPEWRHAAGAAGPGFVHEAFKVSRCAEDMLALLDMTPPGGAVARRTGTSHDFADVRVP
jgi:glycosyltransferase involved in cell wall biosynthesis